jgi:hypothetical protein
MNAETFTGALSVIDWRQFAAVAFIVAAALLMISWNKRQDSLAAGRWLCHSALSLELLGLALSLFWAVKAADGAVMPWLFCAGWTGMLIGRAVMISFVVRSWQQGHYGRAVGGVLTLLIAYTALYGSGLFHAINDAGDAAQQRLESSRPALALDAEIENARSRIAALAGFSDAEKAHAETVASKAQAQANQAQNASLRSQLAAAKATLSQCNPTHKTLCVRPAQAEIARLESLIGNVGAVSGSDYAARHDEYNGLQLHLVELQKQRAAVSASGQGVVSAWKPEDNMLAWLFGITPEQASRVKWLVFTLIFDVLSLLFRIFAALAIGKTSPEIAERLKLEALLNGGFSIQEAMGIMGGNTETARTPQQEQPRVFGFAPATAPAAARDSLPPETQARAPGAFRSWQEQAQARDYKSMTTQGNDSKPMTTKGNGLQVICCESCGAEVKQRTVWQRFCPTCSAERKRGVLRAKAKTVKKS